MEGDYPWIIFTYRNSSETSKTRVRAWRILGRIGALSLRHSAYVVPRTSLVVRKLEQLQEIIRESGGTTQWLDVLQFSDSTRDTLIEQFNLERQQEYGTFIIACDELDAALNRDDEYEAEVKKLSKQFRKLQARDYFGCRLSHTAEERLSDLQQRVPETAGTE